MSFGGSWRVNRLWRQCGDVAQIHVKPADALILISVPSVSADWDEGTA